MFCTAWRCLESSILKISFWSTRGKSNGKTLNRCDPAKLKTEARYVHALRQLSQNALYDKNGHLNKANNLTINIHHYLTLIVCNV